ncbi:hypothetical protein C8R44DRAFT_753963 [Mycena epipterygia]|nr:hypothetical protein C8R44DRAFT_753963 [Mycena epipterygia]
MLLAAFSRQRQANFGPHVRKPSVAARVSKQWCIPAPPPRAVGKRQEALDASHSRSRDVRVNTHLREKFVAQASSAHGELGGCHAYVSAALIAQGVHPACWNACCMGRTERLCGGIRNKNRGFAGACPNGWLRKEGHGFNVVHRQPGHICRAMVPKDHIPRGPEIEKNRRAKSARALHQPASAVADTRANKRVTRMRRRAGAHRGRLRRRGQEVREVRRERVRGWRTTRRRRMELVFSAVVGPATASQSVAESCRVSQVRMVSCDVGARDGKGGRKSGVEWADVSVPGKSFGLVGGATGSQAGWVKRLHEGREEERLRGRKARKSKD